MLALLLCAVSQAQIVVNMATKDGDTISGEKQIRVTVQSQSQVSQVEFYVNDNLVETDDSTPYELTLDTLNYSDGPIKLTVAAYNAKGESKKLTLTLKVDNGLALGVQHHVDVANKDLVDQKWDDAIMALRVALKIDSKDNGARLAMARAYFGKGEFDLAEKYARDVVDSDSGNLAAQDLLAGISLRTAFNAMGGGSDRDQMIQTMANAFQMASKVRNESLSERLTKFGTVTDDNRLDYVDLLNEAGRYSLAIDQLTPIFNRNPGEAKVTDRLLYAQLRAGRFVDAQKTMRYYVRAGTLDGYGYAMKAIIDNWFGAENDALDAEREALLSDPSGMGIRTAQAFLAIRRNNFGAFSSITSGLDSVASPSAITNYYLCALYYAEGQYSQSDKAFQTGLLADPTLYNLYIERFNESISYYLATSPSGKEKDYQLRFAKAFADGALQAKPESYEALTALTLWYMLQDKWEDALRLGQAATAAGPQYPAAHYALAGAYFAVNNSAAGTKMMDIAGKLDPTSLSGIRAPNAVEAWRYFMRWGRTPVVTPPSAD